MMQTKNPPSCDAGCGAYLLADAPSLSREGQRSSHSHGYSGSRTFTGCVVTQVVR